MHHTKNPFDLRMTIISSIIMSILDLVMVQDTKKSTKVHTKDADASSY